jgi:superfamily I DNA and/or RNA helicase
MEQDKLPKLRTVNKSVPAFPLNEFPKDFPFLLGKELVYLLATKENPEIDGTDWEQMFANSIGAEWQPSNVGLDDIVLNNTAWGAKSIKVPKPTTKKNVRLISGRNSPVYSFGDRIDTSTNPNQLGDHVLDIWNERVSATREKFKHVRTVVLIRSYNLSEVVVFEFDTIRYDTELYKWEWNKNNNLIGIDKRTKEHKFTWQPHGSQFTIIEKIPAKSLIIRIKQPESLNKEEILKTLGFDKSWITVIRKNG